MAEDRHLTWENFSQMVLEGTPRRIAVPGFPTTELMIAPDGREIGLLVTCEDDEEIPAAPPLAEISITRKRFDGMARLYVSTSSQRLYREFYFLVLGIADQIQLHNRPIVDAVVSELNAWRTLLRRIAILSAEEEAGLFGELWLLSKLIRSVGVSALDIWVGPQREPHDFRFASYDIEVKTTRNRSRLHVISGLGQLVPTPGKQLYILSLQIQPGGQGGHSLSEVIAEVSGALAGDATRALSFSNTMQQVYGIEPDNGYYSSRHELRSSPMIIEVGDDCPRITPDRLRDLLPPEQVSRIHHVEYTVNLDGLGYPLGTPEFTTLLPID